MQENADTNHINELANEGWSQMKDLLQKHGLEEKKKPGMIAFWTYRIGGLAACILLAIGAYTFFFQSGLDDKNIAHVKNRNITVPTSKKESLIGNKKSEIAGKTGSTQFENINSGNHKKNQTPLAAKINIEKLLEAPNTIILPAPAEAERINKLIRTSFALKINQQQNKVSMFLPVKIDIPKQPLTFSLNKVYEQHLKVKLPVELYAGAGFNISGKRNHQPDFNLSQINIHPAVRLVVPLNKKLSLHTGLYAFSSVNALEASTEKKELVNDVNANLYYTINKASMMKASYFEVPVTLNYHLSTNFTAGAGVEISRLYQFSVKETEKEYDYNENITATNLDRNITVSTLAAPAKKDKISLEKWDPRMVIETTFKKGPLLFSAGYHFGFSTSVTTEETNGTTNHFKNDYFKVGIQYQIK